MRLWPIAASLPLASCRPLAEQQPARQVSGVVDETRPVASRPTWLISNQKTSAAYS